MKAAAPIRRRTLQAIITTLDRRLAGIELVKWPALEASLRRDLNDAMQTARSLGFGEMRPAVFVAKPPKPERGTRVMSCAVCKLATPRMGSTVLRHKGKQLRCCPKCARLA